MTAPTIATALEAAARVRAVLDWAKAADANIRSFFAEEIAVEQARTGVAPKYDLKGLGSAAWTQPNRSTVIEDREALGEWGRRGGLSTQRPEVDASALQHDLDRGEIPGPLLKVLTDAGYIRQRWVFGAALEAVLDDAISDGDRLVTPDGEVVPGVRLVDMSSPQLRVVPAPMAVKRAQVLLAGRLAPLALVELPGGDEAA